MYYQCWENWSKDGFSNIANFGWEGAIINDNRKSKIYYIIHYFNKYMDHYASFDGESESFK